MRKRVKMTIGILVLFVATSGVAADGSSSQSFFGDDFFDDDYDMFEDDEFFQDDSSFEDDWFEDDRDSVEDQNDTEDSESDVGVCVIGVDSPCNSEEYDGDNETINDTEDNETNFPPEEDNETDTTPPEENETDTGENQTNDDTGDSEVTEEAYIESAPEPGDEYYEAGTADWVSYVNPRDEYNPAYDSREEARGSGKVCMILLNEEGETIVGETLPNTEATMELEGIDWHSESTFTAEFPLTENYERPLDSDQIGTSEDLPQGD